MFGRKGFDVLNKFFHSKIHFSIRMESPSNHRIWNRSIAAGHGGISPSFQESSQQRVSRSQEEGFVFSSYHIPSFMLFSKPILFTLLIFLIRLFFRYILWHGIARAWSLLPVLLIKLLEFGILSLTDMYAFSSLIFPWNRPQISRLGFCLFFIFLFWGAVNGRIWA